MNKFNPTSFEEKWKKMWEEKEIYKTPEIKKGDEKFYSLYSFPYPSGAGLHVGHVEGMVANDIPARYNRMKGKNVILPMGWDSFGLPAENYAIKTGIHPEDSTNDVIKTFIDQIKSVGISVDWETEVGAHYENYYKWTQWIFLQLFKAGLAYKKKAPVNWCPQDKTVLANEQVESDGTCERCGTKVVQKDLEQWFFKITEYADRLVDDLDKVDWPESTKTQQREWIGRSEGANIKFEIRNSKAEKIDELEVFTTRPDTLYGATFMVIAPEHDLIKNEKLKIKNFNEIQKYVDESENKTDLERQQSKEKTGVKLEGIFAVNPVNNKEIPIYVADYVLGSYGSGAIMAVPAHDERDFEFANKNGIEIDYVIAPEYGNPHPEAIPKESVSAIMFDESTGKYGYIKWANEGDATMPAGGIEEKDQDKVAALKREIQEETGYTDINIVSELSPVIAYYYAHNKNLWRKNTIYNFLVTVNKNSRGEDSKEDNEDFEFNWANIDEIIKLIERNPSETNEDILFRYKDGVNKAISLGLDKNNKAFQNEIITSGEIINSEDLNGLSVEKAKVQMIKDLEQEGIGKKVKQFKLRDWLVSRQRYWGCPIPVVYDPEGNAHPVDESDLPVKLPKDVDFSPTGESPLAKSEEFQKSAEEKYGKGWRREVDTLDTFIDSSWYFFRHTDASNENEIFDKNKVNAWLPTDLYMIGAEHIVLHLLYARFFTKFFNEQGLIDFDEPFYKMRHMGLILGPDGRKMSKRWGNVINPTDEIKNYGADTLRMYEMFMGPLEDAKPWNDRAEKGVLRFLSKVWDLRGKLQVPNSESRIEERDKQEKEVNKLIKKVGEDIENLSFNTAVAKMMEFTNFLTKEKFVDKSVFERFVLVIAPFAPFIAEELWCEVLENEFSVHQQQWPKYDESLTVDDVATIAVQVNGKVRSTIEISKDAQETEVKEKALAEENVARHVSGEIKKVIYIPGRIINIIV